MGTYTPKSVTVEHEVRTITSTCEGWKVAVVPEAVEWSQEDLPATEATQLWKLLTKYPELFAQDDLDLGCTDVVRHTVKTGDHLPI